jgi:hypothetical protein
VPPSLLLLLPPHALSNPVLAATTVKNAEPFRNCLRFISFSLA